MSLQTRIHLLITAIGADVKALYASLANKISVDGEIGSAATIGGESIGLIDVPVIAQDANYTFVADDAGKCRAKTAFTARTYTVGTAFCSGKRRVTTAGNFHNSGNLTLTGSSVTLRNVADNSTGNIVIPPWAYATIWAVTDNVALVSVTRAP